MPGEINLAHALNSMSVDCDNVLYGFASEPMPLETKLTDFEAAIREKEGTTIIAKSEYLDSQKIKYEGPYAKLTINIHTSLELVGLTAALAAKLTEQGISANVVAAFFHDHIYVPYEQRQKAINAILSLKDEN